MTAECSGGTSAAKGGLAEFVAVSSGAIALALQRYGGSRLQFLIPLLGLPPLELGPFCASDPPALPTFTEDEVFSLLAVRLDADYVSGLAKARDFVLRILWFDLCECTSGTPVAFVEPTLPTNTPLPIGPALDPAVACQSGGTPLTAFDLNSGSGNIGNSDFRGLNATSVRLTARKVQAGAVHGNITWIAHWQTAPSSTFLYETTYTHPPDGVDHEFLITPPAQAGYVIWEFLCTAGTTDSAVVSWDWYCNGNSPTTTQTPCCPPDVSTQSYLDIILNMVTLIQRQAVPFAYVYGANHAGLTDSDEIAAQGLIGVSVDVTTLPDSYGRSAGTPEALFDVGFVSLGTADGWVESRRIDHDGSLVLPTSAGAFTRIGYTLAPGVEISIRELVREP
jgi:hypothetical protein